MDSAWTKQMPTYQRTAAYICVWLITLKSYSWEALTNWLLLLRNGLLVKPWRLVNCELWPHGSFPPDDSSWPHEETARHSDRQRQAMSHLQVPDIRVLGLLDGDVSNTAPGSRLSYSAPSAKLHGVAPALLLVPHSPSAPRRRHSWICRYLCCFHLFGFVFLRRFEIGEDVNHTTNQPVYTYSAALDKLV